MGSKLPGDTRSQSEVCRPLLNLGSIITVSNRILKIGKMINK